WRIQLARRLIAIGAAGCSSTWRTSGLDATSIWCIELSACRAQTWVDQRVQHVDHQAHQHKSQRHDQGYPLDDRVVACANRLVHVAANARHTEDGLDDDCPAEQPRDLDASYGDDRDSRVGEHVS